MFFGQCVPHDGVTVMPYSVDAGVEEIMGLDVPSGCPGVVWVCFWAPGHPDGTSKPMISSTPASPCETVEPFHEHGAHTGFQHGSLKFSVERR